MNTPPPILIKMQTLAQEFESTSDRRAIFLNCYTLMTQNMHAAIQAQEFRDRNWMHNFVIRFADFYFDALQAYESKKSSTPAVWTRAHDAAQKPGTHVLQLLLLGINAHINYDLVLTLVDILEPEWGHLTADARAERRYDYNLTNDIIARTIDVVQDQVVERENPLMDVVDKSLGRFDEWLISQMITNWRDDVWDEAAGIMTATDAQERQRLLDRFETSALNRADAILLRRRSTS